MVYLKHLFTITSVDPTFALAVGDPRAHLPDQVERHVQGTAGIGRLTLKQMGNLTRCRA